MALIQHNTSSQHKLRAFKIQNYKNIAKAHIFSVFMQFAAFETQF